MLQAPKRKAMEGQRMKIAKVESCPELPTSLKTSCRICGTFSLTVVKIFTNQGLFSDLGNKINLYLPVEVQPGDGLPEQCCWECTSSVMSWHKLYLTSKTTEEKLMMYKKVHSALKQPEIKIKSCVEEDELKTSEVVFLEEEQLVEEVVENDEELENIEEVSIEDEPEDEDFIEFEETYEELDEETFVDFTEKPKEHVLVESIKELYDEEQVSCHICHKLFKNQQCCNFHFGKVHGTVPKAKKIPCPICGMERKEERMKGHIARIHSDERPFSCEVCKKTFKVEADLKLHMALHADLRLFKCRLCPRAFNAYKSLKYHSNTHLKSKPVPCKLCGVIFCRKDIWLRHLRKSHEMTEQQYLNIPPEELKKFESVAESRTCKECNITFKYIKWRNAHIRKEHPREYKKKYFIPSASDGKPFLCDVCGGGFKTKGLLKKHSYVHLEEKPFKCHLCPKNYCTKFALNKHQKVHKDNKSTLPQ